MTFSPSCMNSNRCFRTKPIPSCPFDIFHSSLSPSLSLSFHLFKSSHSLKAFFLTLPSSHPLYSHLPTLQLLLVVSTSLASLTQTKSDTHLISLSVTPHHSPSLYSLLSFPSLLQQVRVGIRHLRGAHRSRLITAIVLCRVLHFTVQCS